MLYEVITHLIAIHAGFLGRAQGKGLAGPDGAGIHFRFRLEQGHAPFLRIIQDGPVQGRGAPVPDDARVQHQAQVVAPDGLRDGPAQVGGQDEMGAEQVSYNFV